MYCTTKDFITDWKNESSSTLKILKSLTNDSLKQKVTPEGRTLGFIAWHIILTLGEMGNKAGLRIEAPPENIPEPNSVDQMISTYEKASLNLEEEVRKNWNDDLLLKEIVMYGEKWLRGYMLSVLLKHEIHHRAQMTVLMRQAGLKSKIFLKNYLQKHI